jgi:apolipoprotein N-acyltransferase
MSRDELCAAALVLAFAVVVTAHVLLLAGLARRPPRWRALVALLVPPLAPYWGWREQRRRAVTWVAGAVAYGALLLWARR